MKWTERQIDSFDRIEQIDALNTTLAFLQSLEEKKGAVKAANQKIVALKQKADQMKSGLPIKKLLVIALAAFIVLSVFVGINAAFSLVLVLLIAYVAADKVRFAKDRAEKAARFYDENFPALSQEKARAEAALNALNRSDDAYNARMILPDEYLSSGKVQALSNLLRQRRARSISEAMMLYENMEHQKRLEKIEEDKLKAAQETAEAQKQAAKAAQNTEKITRQMAEEQKKQARQPQQIVYTPSNTRAGKEEPLDKGPLRRCPSCTRKISRDAVVCPYCHEKPREYNPLWGIF